MKYNSGQKFIIILVILVALVVGWSLLKTKSQIASLKSSQTEQTEDQSEKSLKKIKVTAKNGKFRPNNFEVPINDSIALDINSVDQDYNFQLKDFGINKKLPKGKTTRVKIEGLGIGKYQYSCGPDCSGTVEVFNKSDEED